MANLNPNLENLSKGRGKKPKLEHQPFTVNLHILDKEKLDKIARSLDCKHGDKGSLSRLLSQIAHEKLMVIETPPNWKQIDNKELEPYINDFDEVIDEDLEDLIVVEKYANTSVS